MAVDCWKSNVKKEEECVDSVSRNGESESVLSGSHSGKFIYCNKKLQIWHKA